ncbi:MAG: oligosaccharide flippase family protein [Bryobacteraceae bacterium]
MATQPVTSRLRSLSPLSRHLAGDIAALSVVQAINYLVPLITVPYLVRVLQPAHFGLLSFAQGIVLFFSFLTDFGFDYSATRALAAGRRDPESLSRIYWPTLASKLILLCFSAAALFLLAAHVPTMRQASPLIYASFLYVIGTTLFPIWLFQGTGNLPIAAVLLGAGRLLTVPLLFLFVRNSQDYVIAGGIQASLEVTAGILALPITFKRLRVRWYCPSFADIVKTFAGGWPLFVSGAAIYASTTSITVLLGFLSGNEQVGYYSAADKMIKACIAASTPMAMALYPHIAALNAESRASALRTIRKSLTATGGIMLLVSLLALVLAPYLCPLLLGSSFAPSIAILRLLSPLPLLYGLMAVLGSQTMVVFGMERELARLTLLSVAITSPVSIVLIVFFGGAGAAVSSDIQMLLTVGAIMFFLRASGLCVWRGVSPAAGLLNGESGVG